MGEGFLGSVGLGIDVVEFDVGRGGGRASEGTGYDMEGACGGRGGEDGGEAGGGRVVVWDGDDTEVSHEPGTSAVPPPTVVLG